MYLLLQSSTSSGNISASKLLANDLTLVGLPDTSENKSLMIDSDGVVSGRTLGSNAFTTTTIGTTTNALTDGNGIADFTFNGSAGATVAVEASQTTITSILATDLVVGEDSQTKIDFETANEIHFDANNVEVMNITATGAGAKSVTIAGAITSSGHISGSSLTVGGDISASGDLYGKNLYGADAIYHDNDANTGLLFSSDTIQLKGNNQQIASFATNQISIGHAVDGPTNISGSTVGILGNVTAAGSVTAASFVGDLTGDVTGKADTADAVTNALTVDDATLQLDSGTTFNGSGAKTISIKDGGVDSDALAASIAVTSLTATDITVSSLTVTSLTSSIVTSSILQTEGSNIFGDTISDTHTFNGHITASGNITASAYYGDGSNLTGISGQTDSSLTDGNGITDFSFDGSAGATVAIDLDGDTLTVGGSGIKISDAGVNVTQLHASVAGDGLAGGGGNALSVNVDDATIEINSDTIRIKDGGIDSDALAANISLTNLTASIVSANKQLATGSFVGDGSSLTGIASAMPAGVVSSSTQIDGLITDAIAADYCSGTMDDSDIPIAILAEWTSYYNWAFKL